MYLLFTINEELPFSIVSWVTVSIATIVPCVIADQIGDGESAPFGCNS